MMVGCHVYWTLYVSVVISVCTTGVQGVCPDEETVDTGEDAEICCFFSTNSTEGNLTRHIYKVDDRGRYTGASLLNRTDPHLSLTSEYITPGYRYILTVHNTTRDDAGQYECVGVLGDEGGKEKIFRDHFTLTIRAPPLIVRSSGDVVNVYAGSHIQIFCVTESYPPATVTWAKLHDNGSSTDVGGASHVLVLRNVTAADMGSYQCIANNSMPPNAEAIINVSMAALSCNVNKCMHRGVCVLLEADGDDNDDDDDVYDDDGEKQCLCNVGYTGQLCEGVVSELSAVLGRDAPYFDAWKARCWGGDVLLTLIILVCLLALFVLTSLSSICLLVRCHKIELIQILQRMAASEKPMTMDQNTGTFTNPMNIPYPNLFCKGQDSTMSFKSPTKAGMFTPSATPDAEMKVGLPPKEIEEGSYYVKESLFEEEGADSPPGQSPST